MKSKKKITKKAPVIKSFKTVIKPFKTVDWSKVTSKKTTKPKPKKKSVTTKKSVVIPKITPKAIPIEVIATKEVPVIKATPKTTTKKAIKKPLVKKTVENITEKKTTSKPTTTEDTTKNNKAKQVPNYEVANKNAKKQATVTEQETEKSVSNNKKASKKATKTTKKTEKSEPLQPTVEAAKQALPIKKSRSKKGIKTIEEVKDKAIGKEGTKKRKVFDKENKTKKGSEQIIVEVCDADKNDRLTEKIKQTKKVRKDVNKANEKAKRKTSKKKTGKASKKTDSEDDNYVLDENELKYKMPKKIEVDGVMHKVPAKLKNITYGNKKLQNKVKIAVYSLFLKHKKKYTLQFIVNSIFEIRDLYALSGGRMKPQVNTFAYDVFKMLKFDDDYEGNNEIINTRIPNTYNTFPDIKSYRWQCYGCETPYYLAFTSAMKNSDCELKMFWKARELYLLTYSTSSLVFEVYYCVEELTDYFFVDFNNVIVEFGSTEEFRNILNSIVEEYRLVEYVSDVAPEDAAAEFNSIVTEKYMATIVGKPETVTEEELKEKEKDDAKTTYKIGNNYEGYLVIGVKASNEVMKTQGLEKAIAKYKATQHTSYQDNVKYEIFDELEKVKSYVFENQLVEMIATRIDFNKNKAALKEKKDKERKERAKAKEIARKAKAKKDKAKEKNSFKKLAEKGSMKQRLEEREAKEKEATELELKNAKKSKKAAKVEVVKSVSPKNNEVKAKVKAKTVKVITPKTNETKTTKAKTVKPIVNKAKTVKETKVETVKPVTTKPKTTKAKTVKVNKPIPKAKKTKKK